MKQQFKGWLGSTNTDCAFLRVLVSSLGRSNGYWKFCKTLKLKPISVFKHGPTHKGKRNNRFNKTTIKHPHKSFIDIKIAKFTLKNIGLIWCDFVQTASTCGSKTREFVINNNANLPRYLLHHFYSLVIN